MWKLLKACFVRPEPPPVDARIAWAAVRWDYERKHGPVTNGRENWWWNSLTAEERADWCDWWDELRRRDEAVNAAFANRPAG